ncbi:MAG: WG repeat-containing protein [Acetatifactor sp.]|nr:WG repeat-containing protein [Acetatifactor sp.]
MNKARILLSVGLVVVAIACWISYGNKMSGRDEEYAIHISNAEAYAEKHLYQKAIAEYEKAFKINNDEKQREAWLAAYWSAFEDGVIEEKKYTDALTTFCVNFPQRIDMWEKLISYQLETRNYDGARISYLRSAKAGVTSDKLEEYKNAIYYSYREWGQGMPEVTGSTSGRNRVRDDRGYGSLDSLGKVKHYNTYLYIGPIGKEKVYLLGVSEEEMRVVDDADVVQAIIKPAFEDTKAIGDGIIPYLEQGKWYYFDYVQGQKILGPYDDASTFYNGLAAVKKGDNWIIINKKGDEVGAGSFKDVVLLDNGEYVMKDVMVASDGKYYGIYDAKGNPKNEFSAPKIDFCMNDWLAFQDGSGKWGFVDLAGEVQIKPGYEEALSFSNGLAAVKKDGNWGYVNHDNVMVIENKYSGARYVSGEGIAMVASGEPQSWHVLALRFEYGK